jgi:hypothetical protein
MLGLAGDGAKMDARHWNQIQRRGVVLGDMQAIKAGFVGGGGEFNPLVEKLRDRPCAILNVIEKSDFHDASMVLSAHAREGGHLAFAGSPPSRGRTNALAPQSSLFAIFRRA